MSGFYTRTWSFNLSLFSIYYFHLVENDLGLPKVLPDQVVNPTVHTAVRVYFLETELVVRVLRLHLLFAFGRPPLL